MVGQLGAWSRVSFLPQQRISSLRVRTQSRGLYYGAWVQQGPNQTVKEKLIFYNGLLKDLYKTLAKFNVNKPNIELIHSISAALKISSDHMVKCMERQCWKQDDVKVYLLGYCDESPAWFCGANAEQR